MGWVLGLGLMIGSCGVESPVSVLEESFNLANLQKKEIFTQSFKTEKVDDTLEIEIGADISNTWFGMGVALYKQKEEAVLSADDIGVEYYEGYEDGESWSEGSKSETIYWKVKDPGEYKLLITSNEWEAAGNTKINIRVKRDVKRVYPMILISFLWFVVPLLLWYRDKNFESRRWVSVVPESDDDDDSDGGDDD
jgi:hypothetical protein